MSHYRVRVQTGGVEIEVDSSEKDYTEAKVKELLAAFGPGKAAKVVERPGPKAEEPSSKPTSMVEYVRTLQPRSGTQYVIAIGHYLEQHGGMADGFRTKDLTAGFQTVKYKHANPSEAVRQAKQQGFLMDAKEPGAMVITQTGEAWVKAQMTDGEDAA